MLVVRVCFLFAAAAAATAAAAADFSSPSVASESVVVTEVEEPAAEQENEKSLRLPEDIGGLSQASGEREEEAGAEEADVEGTYDEQNSPLSEKLAELREQMKTLSRKYGPQKGGSIRTIWIGAVGMLLFFILHTAAQMSAGKSIREDIVFRDMSTRITFTGAGLVMAMALLLTGLQEALYFRLSSSAERMSQANSYVRVGGRRMMHSLILIALGFMFGAPLAFLKLFTLTFFWFIGVALLGVGMTLEELKGKTEAIKALHKFVSQTLKPLQENAEANSEILEQILEQLERETAGKGDKQSADADGQTDEKQQGGATAARETTARGSQKRPQQRVDLGSLLTNTVDMDAMLDMLETMLKSISEASRGRVAAQASREAADTEEEEAESVVASAEEGDATAAEAAESGAADDSFDSVLDDLKSSLSRPAAAQAPVDEDDKGVEGTQ